MELDNRLIDLADSHAVSIYVNEKYKGSGFVLAPEWVLTCAHVVESAEDEVRVETADPADGPRVGTVVARHPPRRGNTGYYESPDIALIRLSEPVDRHGVWLADKPARAGAAVLARGFSPSEVESGVQRDSLAITVVGPDGSLERVQGDRITKGMSGALVLDRTTGRVCGMVKASRVLEEVQGGWIVPAHVIARHVAAAVGEQRHRPGTEWFDLASRRAGLHSRLFGDDLAPAHLSAAQRDRPPSWWLQTRNQVVPFIARPELDGLLDWCLRPDGEGIRLVTAPGGTGKTRLAMELCRVLHDKGWIAGFLPGDAQETGPRISAAVAAGYRVLVVVDYAETRPELGRMLLKVLDAKALGAVRVLLLARSGGSWWAGVRPSKESVPIELPPLADHEGPGAVLSAAWQAFHTAIIGGPVPALPVRLLGADGPRDALGLHAAALDEVLARRDGARTGGGSPLGRVLSREQQYWRDLVRQHEPLLSTEDALVRSILLLPALFAAATTEQGESALRRLERVPKHSVAGAARLLRRLYPETGLHWGRLQPDRLAELLLSDVLDDSGSLDATVHLLTTLLTDCTTEQAEQAVTVIERTRSALRSTGSRERADWLMETVCALVRARPLEFVPPAAGMLREGKGWDALNDVLEHADYFQVLLPLQQRVARTYRTDEVVDEILGALVVRHKRSFRSQIWSREHRETAVALLGVLREISNRAVVLGEEDHAWWHARTAAGFAAKLARAQPETYRPVFADSLDVLIERLVALDRRRAALHAARRAVKERRLLVCGDPAHRPRLVIALTRAGCLSAAARRPRAALRLFEEAARIAVDLTGDHEHGWQAYWKLVLVCQHNYLLLLPIRGREADAVRALDTLMSALAFGESQRLAPVELRPLADYRSALPLVLSRETGARVELFFAGPEVIYRVKGVSAPHSGPRDLTWNPKAPG